MPSLEFWLVNDATDCLRRRWLLDIFIFCQSLTQLAVVEGEIIITTTAALDIGHSQGMIFSSGQARGSSSQDRQDSYS